MGLQYDTDSVHAGDAVDYCVHLMRSVRDIGPLRIEPAKNAPFRALSHCKVIESGYAFHEFDITSSSMHVQAERSDIFALGFALSGNETLKHGRAQYEFGTGEAVLLNTVTTDEGVVQAHGGMRRLFVAIPRPQMHKIFPYIEDKDFKRTLILKRSNQTGLLLHAAINMWGLIKKNAAQGSINLAQDHFEDALISSLYCLPRANNDGRSKMRRFHKERIKTFVKQNLQSALSITEIAQGVGLSNSYVYNIFSDERVSLMKWVWEQRLERCRRDLESPALSDRSIREIAFAWGFNDPAHFSHLFHQHFGKSPTEYRELHRLGLVSNIVANDIDS